MKKTCLFSNDIFYPIEIDKNPMFKLISSFDEIQYILNNKKDGLFKFLYFNKNKIHEILYNLQGNIQINSNIINNDLSEYFYLILLLKDNPNIVNYEYTIKEIQNINAQLKNENNNLFKKLII